MPIRRVRWFCLVLLLALLALGGITPTRAGTPNVHLLFGNPSGAVTDPTYEDNYLIERAQYALAYQRADGIPRWVSWHLAVADIGPALRCDCFTADASLPPGWNRVVSGDYTNSGYDRGHMTPSEDRTATDADNAETFLMTNIVPQTPANNRGPWAYLERDSRILAQAGNELAIISGPVGTLGMLAGGTVRVPAATWKAVLVLPAGTFDPANVTTATRVIAIRIPNDASVQQSDDWQQYQTTVDAVEAETGDDLFSAVPPRIQRVVEARQDPGPLALTLSVIAGDGQSAIVGTEFVAPLTVEVRDTSGYPVAGVNVTFASLGGGVDAQFSNGDTQITVTTGADGRASAVAQAAGAPGNVRVEASIAGVYTPGVITLTTNAVPSAVYVVVLPLVVAP